jgi:hypothetical protein
MPIGLDWTQFRAPPVTLMPESLATAIPCFHSYCSFLLAQTRLHLQPPHLLILVTIFFAICL